MTWVLRLKSIVNNHKFILFVYSLFAALTAFKQYYRGHYNNYLIYKYQVIHTLQQLPLYPHYYRQYADTTHYGPFFSAFFAPFAFCPDWLGVVLWSLFNVWLLFFAVKQLPLKQTQISIVFWIIAQELLNALFNVQVNPAIAAFIVLSYVLVEKEQDIWATALIVIGAFIKVYGIVGLAFFFFSKHKTRFVISGILWSIVAFVLPMFMSSPHFILQSYSDWYHSLSDKNILNTISSMQDISAMGLFRRILRNPFLPNWPFVLTGLAFFTIPYFYWKKYSTEAFRLLLLASVLLFVVLFSSGSESPTYIIALIGVGIWFVMQPQPVNKWFVVLLIAVLIISSFSPSDLFPRYLREHVVRRYALKALPCLIVWGVVVYQMIKSDLSRFRINK